MDQIGKGIFHVHLVVEDLERSLCFYTRSLNGKNKFKDEELVSSILPNARTSLAPQYPQLLRCWQPFMNDNVL